MIYSGKPLAVVDLDDTAADFGNLLVTSLNYHFGKSYTKADFTDFYGILDLYGISYEDFIRVIKQDELMEQCAPLPGTRQMLTALVKDHHVVICTARDYDPDAFIKTEAWNGRHRIPCHQVLIPEKGQKKSEAIIDVFGVNPVVCFDDGLHNVKDFTEAFPQAMIYVPHQPWNKARLEGINPMVNYSSTFRSAVREYYYRLSTEPQQMFEDFDNWKQENLRS